MAIEGVELQILEQILRFSKVKVVNKNAVANLGGDGFWTLVDDSDNEVYENIVKGSDMTTLDGNINNASIGIHARQWISLHDQYQNRGLGLTNGTIGLITSFKWRVPQEFADVYFESLSRRLPSGIVSAESTNLLAVVAINSGGSVTSSSFASLNRTLYSDTPLQIIATENLADDVTVRVKVKTYLKETDPIEISGIALPSGMAQNDFGDAVFIGECQLDVSAEAGSTELDCDMTQSQYLAKGFVDGGYILITEEISGQVTPQFIKLKAGEGEGVTSGNRLVFEDGATTKHNYTTSAKVYPCFSEVTEITRTAGAVAVGVAVVPIDDFDIGLHD